MSQSINIDSPPPSESDEEQGELITKTKSTIIRETKAVIKQRYAAQERQREELYKQKLIEEAELKETTTNTETEQISTINETEDNSTATTNSALKSALTTGKPKRKSLTFLRKVSFLPRKNNTQENNSEEKKARSSSNANAVPVATEDRLKCALFGLRGLDPEDDKDTTGEASSERLYHMSARVGKTKRSSVMGVRGNWLHVWEHQPLEFTVSRTDSYVIIKLYIGSPQFQSTVGQVNFPLSRLAFEGVMKKPVEPAITESLKLADCEPELTLEGWFPLTRSSNKKAVSAEVRLKLSMSAGPVRNYISEFPTITNKVKWLCERIPSLNDIKIKSNHNGNHGNSGENDDFVLMPGTHEQVGQSLFLSLSLFISLSLSLHI